MGVGSVGVLIFALFYINYAGKFVVVVKWFHSVAVRENVSIFFHVNGIFCL